MSLFPSSKNPWQQWQGQEVQHRQNDEGDLEDDLVKLEKCIDKLQDEQKVCVELFFLKKIPYQSIANKTGFELKKIKSYIQNGKRNLKICMENQSE